MTEHGELIVGVLFAVPLINIKKQGNDSKLSGPFLGRTLIPYSQSFTLSTLSNLNYFLRYLCSNTDISN